ncbi:beta strand repeat-containing protein, partial [Clostridium novyi]|uniref:beta strand repeat-containing protein n=1 Tax=Clostridium novyi TaxID=1542 RepID=UPI00057ECE43
MALYLQYQTTITGDITFIGNTIRSNKESHSVYTESDNPIDKYKTSTTITSATNYPNSTTEFINNNYSESILKIPKNSTIQSAYLIWGGNFTEELKSNNNKLLMENRVYLQFPISNPTESSINYKTEEIYPSGKEIYTKSQITSDNLYTFYTNWADVTSYIKYPGIFKFSYIVSNTNPLNCCGWILAVLYKNSFLPTRNFSLYIGIDSANNKTPININTTNFTTPIYTPPKGNLLIGTLNNNAPIDEENQILFGSNKTNLTPLSFNKSTHTSDILPYRTENIYNKSNTIVNPQGIDIKNIDTSPVLTNNQTSANIRFISKNNPYFVNVVSNQVNVDEPVFDTSTIISSEKYVTVGDIVQFTINVINTGNVLAEYITLKDTLPSEFSFVSNSLTIDGVSSTQDITDIVNLKNLDYNEFTTLTFSATVNSPVSGGYTYINNATLNYSFQPPTSSGYLTKDFNFTPNVLYNASIAILPLFNKSSTSSNTINKVADVGDTIYYTINIVNLHSSSDITNVVVTDTLPNGLTYKAGTLSINNIPSSDDLSSIVVGTVPHNSTTTIIFSVNVTDIPDNNSEYVNYADINYEFEIYDGTILSNTMSTTNSIYSYSIVIIPNVTKTSASSNTNPNIATIGDTIDYVITVTNPSTSAAIQNVTLNDTLPTGLTYKAGSLTINGVSSSDNLTSINIGNINPSSTATINFTADVTASPGSDFKYVNSAVTNYEFLAPDGTALSNNITANNTIYYDSVLITPNLTKTAISSNSIPNTAAIGDTIDYTITIYNTSTTNTILNSILNDTLPTGLTYKTGSLTINGVSSSDNLTSINIGNINPSSTATINFTADVTGNPISDSKYVNLVNLNYEFLTPDSTTLNNNVSTNNTIYSSSVVITPTITKSDNTSNTIPHVVGIGDTVTYTITISNTSTTNTILNSILNDTLPTGLTYKTGSLTINGVSSSDNLTSINIGNINPSSTTTINFTADVTGNPVSDSKYVNLANLNYEFLTPDSTTLSNNVSTNNTIYSSSVVITPTITKSDNTSNTIPHIVAIGDTVTYTITISNPDATQPITNINLTDTLPSGLTFKTGSVSINGSPDASADPTTGISIPTIAASSDATVSFVADVTAAPSGGALKYVNTVTTGYTFQSPDSTP